MPDLFGWLFAPPRPQPHECVVCPSCSEPVCEHLSEVSQPFVSRGRASRIRVGDRYGCCSCRAVFVLLDNGRTFRCGTVAQTPVAQTVRADVPREPRAAPKPAVWVPDAT